MAKYAADSINGWVLVARDTDGDNEWYVAWHELFSRRHVALDFARKNSWMKPYKAVRGHLHAQLVSPPKMKSGKAR